MVELTPDQIIEALGTGYKYIEPLATRGSTRKLHKVAFRGELRTVKEDLSDGISANGAKVLAKGYDSQHESDIFELLNRGRNQESYSRLNQLLDVLLIHLVPISHT